MLVIHVIDDDSAVARTIVRSVKDTGWRAVLHASASDFLAEIDSLETGCILCDIKMPGVSGLDLLGILKEKQLAWPVIMMTGYGTTATAVQAFRGGAIHFLQKPFRKAELLQAVEEASEQLERLRAEAERKQRTAAIATLTERENQVLAMLAEGRQSKVIAYELGIGTRTVEMHRSNILRKLKATNSSEAVALFLQARGQ